MVLKLVEGHTQLVALQKLLVAEPTPLGLGDTHLGVCTPPKSPDDADADVAGIEPASENPRIFWFPAFLEKEKLARWWWCKP